ncbi:MAG: hypothetical protein ACRD19_10760, partial [Terriglobia bacterium]
MPLPDALRNPPPVSDFDAYLTYNNSLKDFLTSQQYLTLNWISDMHWRLSGPSTNPPGGDNSNNYGPHFPLKVYYSPEVVDWLCNGRKGQLPDGAMILKAMSIFKVGETPLVKVNVAADGCMDLDQNISPNLWAPMLKTSQSHDGWFWMLQQPDLSKLGSPPQFPPPLFDASAFTQSIPATPGAIDPTWLPTGSILEEPGPPILGVPLKVPNVVMLHPLAGFAYCLSCHATAKSESTFASMDNILGRELRYKSFPVEAVEPTPTQAASPDFSPFPKPLTQPSPEFLSFFDQMPPVSFANVWASRMPAETYDQQVISAHDGPGQFLTAAQCDACHNATPQSPLLPNMVFVADQAGRSSRLRNLSPYGEWRVSPMGLAGRDPVFFSQLQGETNNLPQFKACIENTCLHCHAVMGQ